MGINKEKEGHQCTYLGGVRSNLPGQVFSGIRQGQVEG